MANGNAWSGAYFVLALGGAALTSCYMFRMWFMTFVGTPRDEERYDHAHESPPVMYLPLVILAIFAVTVAWDFTLIGYGIVAATFFIFRGVQQGWFKPAAQAHGHAAHGHGHDSHGHGHDAHGHSDHGHGHDSHSHDTHGEPAAAPFSWSWLALMLLCSLFFGGLIQLAIGSQIPETAGVRTLSLVNLLEDARPAGTLAGGKGHWLAWTWPSEHFAHEPAQFATIVAPVTLMATGTWVGGILIAAMLYWWGILSPEDVRRQFASLHTTLWNKYYFDELYDFLFVRPTHVLARFFAGIDKFWIDWAIDLSAKVAIWFSRAWDLIVDRGIVDFIANLTATWTYSLGTSLRTVQTGRLRQYVLFIVVGAIAIFVLISFFWSPASFAR
jgi:NADH-quinone oxidoreductase subunit L